MASLIDIQNLQALKNLLQRKKEQLADTADSYVEHGGKINVVRETNLEELAGDITVLQQALKSLQQCETALAYFAKNYPAASAWANELAKTP